MRHGVVGHVNALSFREGFSILWYQHSVWDSQWGLVGFSTSAVGIFRRFHYLLFSIYGGRHSVSIRYFIGQGYSVSFRRMAIYFRQAFHYSRVSTRHYVVNVLFQGRKGFRLVLIANGVRVLCFCKVVLSRANLFFRYFFGT